MYSRLIVALLIASIALCSSKEEGGSGAKYSTACLGQLNTTTTIYRSFVDKYSNLEKGSMMSECPIDYFTAIPDDCNDNHKACVKLVQEFMWDRCHWRLLYAVENNLPDLLYYLEHISTVNSTEVIAYYKALSNNDVVYAFATKCGSWDWIGILIMVVSAFVGAYILLWIVGGIMKCIKDKKPKTEKEE